MESVSHIHPGSGSTGIALDPGGRFLFVPAAAGSSGIEVYAIDAATGSLTIVTGSPFGSLGRKLVVN